jgi:type I restriction enzyme, S subunit
MKFGLDDITIEAIQKVFENYSKVDEVMVFGSRAKGNYKEGSDIDLTVKGNNITLNDILSLGGNLEDLNLPYKFDLLDYSTIKEKALVEHIDRVGIQFYKRWKRLEIKDIIESANTGLDAIKRAPIVDYDSGVKCLRIQDVSQSKKYADWGFCTVEERNFKKFQLKKYEILIARTGASIGVNKFIKKDFNSVFNNGLIRLRVNKLKCLPEFLYYNFRTNYYNDFIESISGGTSTQPNMQINALLSFEINLPPLFEQARIVETLSSLDNKIDLLQRQNNTLEQLAETLFRQRFVEEADESWEVEKLGNLFDIGIGRTPPRKEHHWFSENPNDIKWISIKDMGDNGIYIDSTSEYLTEEAVQKFNIPVIPENTVLLSFKMTIGRLGITTEKMLSNEAIAHFKEKVNSALFTEYLYLFLKIYNWQQLGSTSSIVDAINSQMIKDLEMQIADEGILSKFRMSIKPYFKKIKANSKQIKSLSKLRDTLLPKLMSGEIRIKI